MLPNKQLLLVLDNCEHLLGAVARLVTRIERECPGVVVLATSREGLAVEGEQLLPCPHWKSAPRMTIWRTRSATDAVSCSLSGHDRSRRISP